MGGIVQRSAFGRNAKAEPTYGESRPIVQWGNLSSAERLPRTEAGWVRWSLCKGLLQP